VGLNVGSAVIGPIIPPSIPFVIFAMVTDVSTGKLFLGGVFPGLLMGLSLMIYVYVVSVKRNYPREKPFAMGEFLESLKRAFLTLMTPVILLGGIYGGFFTVTEAAGVAVVYATILSTLVYRLLGLRKLFDVLCRVFVATGPVLLIFPAAKMFGYVLTVENLPDLFANWVLDLTTTPWVIILIINILFLVLGCFADPNVNIMLFVPIVMPLILGINMDPVHFGVMIVLNAMIDLTTPPVGQLLFAVSSFTKCSFEQIVRGVIPFTIILLVDLAIIIAVPWLVTFLPNLFYK
jgi:tripartite ATP-independent transporter DctM subunit